MLPLPSFSIFFFFNDTATTEIYTLSLHDALPISPRRRSPCRPGPCPEARRRSSRGPGPPCDRGRTTPPRNRSGWRSEEHTSELQSRLHLVCRLLLEKKKKKTK